MPPVSTAWRPRAAVTILLALLLGACTGAPGADRSFDPSTPCTTDGRQPGAYPDLEARIPDAFRGATPASLDSGRNCSDESLGTLRRHGIDEVRYAGGLWETGEQSGVTIARFAADGLTAERLAEFYEAGARTARRTDNVESGPYEAGSVEGRRIDALNDDSFQTIVVVDAAEADVVHAILVASWVGESESRAAHDAVVREAVEAAVAGDAGEEP